MQYWWIPILSLVGAMFGGIIGTWVKLKSEESRYMFNHKIEAYKKIIAAYRELVALDKDDKNYEKYRQKYVEAQKQVELVGSEEVILISKEFYRSYGDDQHKIEDRLVTAMRNDLYRDRKF